MKTMCPPGPVIITTTLWQLIIHTLLRQSHYGDNLKSILFSRLHICNAYLAPVKFEHSVCSGSLIATYICMYVCMKILYNSKI